MKQCTVDQCPNKALRRGYCPKHYQRWRRHGDPNIVLTIRNNTEKRFWSKIDKNGPTIYPELGQCWIWTGTIVLGYGQFATTSRHKEQAHRIAFYYKHGYYAEPMCLHKCDNKRCVNPDHLYEGTASQNLLDVYTRNRGRLGYQAGADHPQAKFTSPQIQNIRQEYKTSNKVLALFCKNKAEEFQVSPFTIKRIILNKTYQSND